METKKYFLKHNIWPMIIRPAIIIVIVSFIYTAALVFSAELSSERNKEAHVLLPLDLLDTKRHPKAAVEVLQQLGRVRFNKLITNDG